MPITLNKEKLFEALEKLGNVEEFEAIIARWKELGFNPFDFNAVTGDPKGWADTVEGAQLLNDLIMLAIRTVEVTAADVAETVSSEDKLDSVVSFLDDIIDAPWYMEAFDGPALHAMVVGLVSLLNSWFGHDWIDHIPKRK